MGLSNGLITILVMNLFNISKTARAIDFKISHNVVLNSRYILTGNDVTIYFWSATTRVNVLFLGHILIEISQ